MNKNEERSNKKLAKITGLRGLVFAAGLLTLMGCGRNVVDTTVTQQPTQTIETTVDDPVVDVPVEPTTDVSDNENDNHEDLFESATLIQTGDNSYQINLDCPDNSTSPEIQTLVACDLDASINGKSELFGVSKNLTIAVLTHGMQSDSSNLTELNYNVWREKPVDVNICVTGNRTFVMTDNPALYDGFITYTEEDLKYDNSWESFSQSCKISLIFLQDCLNHTNGNITCALTRYKVGPDAWDNAMQACMDKTGLTEEEVYDNFDAGYVLSFDNQELDAANYATEVLSYITPEEEIVITTINSGGQVVTANTYVVTQPKRYGSR